MPKKKKPIRKTKKKPARSVKSSRGKKPAPKKKPARKQKKKAGVVAVEVLEIDSIGVVEDNSSAGATNEDDMDEDFPPEYGGSE